MSTIKFSNASHSFHSELKKRITDYFKEVGKPQTGNYKLFTKAIILVVSFLFVYIHLVFFTPFTFLAVIECILLGGLTAAIGFNVMHDGAHGSFSKYKWINQLAGLSLNFLGANNFMWKFKHNVIHHAYTNIDGIDDDIDAKPFLRLCETQKHYKLHKYQHLYFWFAYSLLYIYWIFVLDYRKYFSGKIGTFHLLKMRLRDHISFWAFKIFHMGLFVVFPIYAVGFSSWIIGFLVYALFSGFVLSIVFQLAHTVEHTHFPVPDTVTGKIEDEWAIHQIKTTANFATKNKMVTWLVGGLNFQIEHHLFPKISHIHYPAISQIIKKACREYGIHYIEYPKVRYAVASHVKYLRQLGRQY
ncbi:MAG TPA: acyl-CoA desaturase [Chitinophagaceae bacterium]|nr:acyl-CoA desaturase [Chitinophagaceae bacterium]